MISCFMFMCLYICIILNIITFFVSLYFLVIARDEKTVKDQASILHHPLEEASMHKERSLETDKQLDEHKNFGECFDLAVCKYFV